MHVSSVGRKGNKPFIFIKTRWACVPTVMKPYRHILCMYQQSDDGCVGENRITVCGGQT